MPDSCCGTHNSAQGFESEPSLQLSLPADYFQVLKSLPASASLHSLVLGFFALLSQQEGNVEVLAAFQLEDALLNLVFDGNETSYQEALSQALEYGLILQYTEEGETWYLPGTPQGRQTCLFLHDGALRIEDCSQGYLLSLEPRANIFQLYEQNFGPLTSMLADELRADELAYPEAWIKDAIREALLHNARSWKYVQAILKNWKENGRGPVHEKDKKRDSETQRYLEFPRTGRKP